MNYFDVKAIEHERIGLKRIKNRGASVVTGSGRENLIEKITPQYIYFRTWKSKAPIKVSRQKVRDAIAFLLFKRTVMRVQLEKFTKFSSFLMGFLRLSLVELAQIAKLQKTVKGFRIFMKGLRFHFAGCDRDPSLMRMISDNGGKWILCSYWFLRDDVNENWKRHAKRFNLKVLLDSGEFSYYKARKRLQDAEQLLSTMVVNTPEWRKQLQVVNKLASKNIRPISLPEYCDFIKKHQDILVGAINVDVTGDPKRSKLHANYMRSRGIDPIEVWHPQSGFDALDEMVREGHDLIAIGGTVHLEENERHSVLDRVFAAWPDQPFHILGCSSTALYRYPIFSSDSTGPIMGRRFLTLITEAGHVKADVEHSWHQWDEEEALVFNIKQLAALEECYDGVQTALVVPPYFEEKQLTLF